MLHVKEEFGPTVFVETGTWEGQTAQWAAQNFARVITIENSPEIHRQSRDRLSCLPNVECIFGDSRHQLEVILRQLQEPAIFWLDGHWCGGASYGERDQCPLPDELRLLNSNPIEHFLFIDDARLFLSPPHGQTKSSIGRRSQRSATY